MTIEKTLQEFFYDLWVLIDDESLSDKEFKEQTLDMILSTEHTIRLQEEITSIYYVNTV